MNLKKAKQVLAKYADEARRNETHSFLTCGELLEVLEALAEPKEGEGKQPFGDRVECQCGYINHFDRCEIGKFAHCHSCNTLIKIHKPKPDQPQFGDLVRDKLNKEDSGVYIQPRHKGHSDILWVNGGEFMISPWSNKRLEIVHRGFLKLKKDC